MTQRNTQERGDMSAPVIDAEELAAALKVVGVYAGGSGPADFRAAERLVVEAARAHLATLPRFKEMEVEVFVVVDDAGTIDSTWRCRAQAETRSAGTSRAIVRLTGTAKVRIP